MAQASIQRESFNFQVSPNLKNGSGLLLAWNLANSRGKQEQLIFLRRQLATQQTPLAQSLPV